MRGVIRIELCNGKSMVFRTFCFRWGNSRRSVKKGLQAIEKQIPKKPIMKQCFDDLDDEYLCCPTCGGILTDRIPFDNKDFYFHCMNCGQKFDWSDSD